MSVDNLKSVYEKATPEDVRSALDSYFRYNRIVRDMAAKYGFETRVGAAVFAALSPNNDYHGNLRDAARLLQAAHENRDVNSFRVSTYGPNKWKAWCIAKAHNDPLQVIVAKKTRNFFLNITDPTDPIPVTVDGHMFNCWRNTRVNLVGLKTSPREYEIIAEAVRQFAREVGIIPSQMQGVLWLTHRRIHGIKTPAQSEMWDIDYRAAGLGWIPNFNAVRGQLPLPA